MRHVTSSAMVARASLPPIVAEQQAITTLCLQLLQNSVMLINTLLVQQAVEQHQFLEQLSAEDRRALSPLFYEHVNPYGLFALDLDRPPLLEAA